MEKLDISEKEYRGLDILSYSSIKDFINDRKAFYKKHILKIDDSTEDINQENENIRIGSLVDCLLFTPQEFNARYCLFKESPPKGAMLDFVNNLYKRTVLHSEDGILNTTLDVLMEEAYEDTRKDKYGTIVAFKVKTIEKVKEDFIVNKVGFNYYQALRDSTDKVVISQLEYEKAQSTVETIRTHSYTSHLFDSPGIHQFILRGELYGHELKCMIDMIHIDESKKMIYPYDLKTGWNVDQFDYNYLKYRYYIQNAVYTTMLREYYPDYFVHPMAFLMVDKSNYQLPVIYKTTEGHIEDGIEGFWNKDTYYPGLREALDNIAFHQEKGIWNSARNVIEGKGVVELKTYTK